MSQLTTERRRSYSPAPSAPTATPNATAEMCSLVFATCAAVFLIKAFIAFRDLAGADAPPQLYDGAVLATLARVTAC